VDWGAHAPSPSRLFQTDDSEDLPVRRDPRLLFSDANLDHRALDADDP
jgi:hypothetical protein